MIEIDKIHFRYDKRAAVFDDFSLDVQPGITLFNGFSGCGKTTLLRLMAGFLTPKAGEIRFPDQTNQDVNDFRRRQMSFVFQGINMLPLASFRRNCELAAANALSPDQFDRNLAFWSERLGVGHLLDCKPSALSGGQNQRASLARALIRAPRFLFMDEPTSGLDDTNTNVLINALKEYFNQSGTERYIVISTHDSRLKPFANEIHDFNHLLSVEGHHCCPKQQISV